MTVAGISPLCISTRNSVLEQQLVGHRVKILAQHGALLEHAGQGAVQRIGEARGDKHVEAQRIAALEDGRHQKRRQADAHQREQVGRGAERV